MAEEQPQAQVDLDLDRSADLKALAREHESRKARIEAEFAANDTVVKDLLRLLAEKDRELKNLKLDKDFEADGRRRWQDRATLVESKIQGAQHLLLLIDGNQHFFKDTFLRAGAAGVKDAVQPFLEEVRQFARDQHKHDLLENTVPIVHVFSDIDQLAKDLQNAGALPDPSSLLDFCQELCKVQPYFTISDCSMDPRAAATKVEKFYELYVENCHCRHIFLALGHDSEYYKTLQMYNDDQYTKSKTSLIRPDQGFSGAGVDLSYHTVKFSTLCSIPRAPVDSPQTSQPSLNGGAKDNNSHVDLQPPIIANRYSSVTSTVKPLVNPGTVPLSPDNPHQLHDLAASNGDLEAREVVKVAPTIHSSSSSNNVAEQTWETKVSEHSYTPGPILGDWGEEVNASTQWQPPSYPSRGPPAYKQPNTNGNGNPKGKGRQGAASATTWKRPENPRNGSGTSRRMPVQFEGSFDEMPPSEEPKSRASHQRNQSMVSSRTSNEVSPSSRLTAAVFKRQMVEVADPNPTVRPIWSPVGLNKSDQRIDLNLPKPAQKDAQYFSVRTQQRRLCYDHHLLAKCDDTNCPFDHEFVADGVYLALRINARKSPCVIGPSCRKHNCYAGHHCPNVGNVTDCGRKNCPFNNLGMHKVKDHEIVKVIDPPPSNQA